MPPSRRAPLERRPRHVRYCHPRRAGASPITSAQAPPGQASPDRRAGLWWVHAPGRDLGYRCHRQRQHRGAPPLTARSRDGVFEVESPARRSDRKRTPTLARGSRDPLKAFAGRQDDPGDPVIRARPLRIMTVSVTALLRSRGRRRRHGVPRDVRGCPERALRSSTLDATSAYEIMVDTFDPVGSAPDDRRLRRGRCHCRALRPFGEEANGDQSEVACCGSSDPGGDDREQSRMTR